ncbi:hypothetical protein [Lactiplantibacillus plantarum]|uniref:hypothetical protein n=1 Tax=Lactiplantibacillus plantarum TaxID=1590 RepID=UPI0009767463|nr:hypothetical protein [Lactiplantibacillus plantarum]
MSEEFKDFKSLLRSSHCATKDRWYPASIDNYRDFFYRSIKTTGVNNIDFKLVYSNLAYNMQNLEYIKLQLDSLVLSSVLEKMLYKSFIITGMSIVEAIFYITLVDNGELSKHGWVLQDELVANKGKIRVTTKIEVKKDNPGVLTRIPSLDSMIKKVNKLNNKKSLPWDLSKDDFPVLKNLRKLRNRVHINGVDSNSESIDSDYAAFSENEYLLMNKILEHLLGIKIGEI